MSKNVYIDTLADIVNKHNNTYHSATKMKPADIKSSTYIDSSTKDNDKDPKFKFGDHITTWKYQNIFAKYLFLLG